MAGNLNLALKLNLASIWPKVFDFDFDFDFFSLIDNSEKISTLRSFIKGSA